MKPTPKTMEDVYDAQFVKGVFDRCSDQYIAFSLFCSFGFTERWRRQCVAMMPEIRTRAAHCYDLMAGTGEVWPHLLRRFQSIASITAVDISSGMHRRAMQRLHAHRAHKIAFVEDDVLASDPGQQCGFCSFDIRAQDLQSDPACSTGGPRCERFATPAVCLR